MITLITMVSSLGFFLLYNTSRKATLGHSTLLEKWAQDHPGSSKCCGLFLFSVAIAASIAYLGTGAGIFSFFVMLMTVGSLIVVVAPLRYIHFNAILLVFLLSLTMELMLS